MPKMSRAMFIDAIDAMWGLAQQTLTAKGIVYPTLLGFDAMTRPVTFIQVPTADPAIENAGAIALTTPFSQNVERIEATFKQHKVVAALMYTEAWVGTDAVALDMLHMGLAPHEHPMKEELLLSIGFWPREFVAHGHRATIQRGDQGQMLGLADYQATDDSATTVTFGWLRQVLPQT